MKKQELTKKEILIAKGNYGRYHKPLAQQLGLEAAVLLEFLVDKYDYFIAESGKYRIINKNKAFYITYNDIEEATCIKASKLGRKSNSNPIQILVSKGLIGKKTIQMNHLKTTYYILFFKKIEQAYDKATVERNNRRIEEKKVKDEKVKALLESDNKGIDDFVENNLNEDKNSLNPNDSLILQNDSMETVDSTSLIVQKKHITKNKIIKNINKKKKLTSEKPIDEDYKFTVKDLENRFDCDTVKSTSINSTVKDQYELYDLYTLIKETRQEIKTPQVFFDQIVNVVLKDKFKGFTMSMKDEMLIYDALINNPLFDYENDDIVVRDNAIALLRKKYDDIITEEEILDEIEFDDDKYEMLYNMVWEKIIKNCERINAGKLEARFGNIFVGVREISENYRPFLDL
jgi:hypothetical protein